MSVLQKLFPSKDLKKFRKILDDLDSKLNNPSFIIVRERMEKWALKNPKDLKVMLNKKIDHELWLIGHTANISGDLVESGEYHLYRGVLNPLSQGEKLLKLFDQSTDLSYEKGEFDKEFAEKQKKQVRINMRSVG